MGFGVSIIESFPWHMQEHSNFVNGLPAVVDDVSGGARQIIIIIHNY